MSVVSPQEFFTRDDLSTDEAPHVIALIRVRGRHGDRLVEEVIGPFSDEAAAFAFIEEHELDRQPDRLALIAPLTAAIEFATRGGR